jgi:hypothetical protein
MFESKFCSISAIFILFRVEGSAAAYLEDLKPLICRICSRLSGGSAAGCLVKYKNKAKLSSAGAAAWAELGNIVRL